MNKQIIDIGLTFGRQLALLFLGIASLPLLTRVLGPDGIGVLTLLTATLAITGTIGIGGIPPAFLYYSGKGQLPGHHVDRVVWILVFIGAMASLLGMAIAFPFLVRSDAMKGLGWGAMAYLLVSLAISLLQIPAVAVARYEKQFGLLALFAIASRLSIIVGLVFFYVWSIHSLQWVLWLYVAVNGLILLGWWIYHIGRKKNADEQPREPVVTLKEIAGYSWKSASANLVAQLNYKADVFLLAVWSTPLQLGIYGVAVLIAEKAWMLSRSVGEVSFTYLTKSSGGQAQMVHNALVTAKWTGLITFAICALLALLAPFLPIILGSRFEGASNPMLLLTPGIFALGVSRIISNSIAAMGRPGLNTIFGMVGVVINILANAILIPKYGASGAAFATSISYGTLLAIRIAYLKFNRFDLTPLFSISGEEISYIQSQIRGILIRLRSA